LQNAKREREREREPGERKMSMVTVVAAAKKVRKGRRNLSVEQSQFGIKISKTTGKLHFESESWFE
jgi:hypothetical protein